MTPKERELLRAMRKRDREEGIWTYVPHPGVIVRPIAEREYGVFATRPFRRDQLIYSSLILPTRNIYGLKQVRDLRGMPFLDFAFAWADDISGFPLSWVSMINHSENPNTIYERDPKGPLMHFYAERNIGVLEQLTIDYGAEYWEGREHLMKKL